MYVKRHFCLVCSEFLLSFWIIEWYIKKCSVRSPGWFWFPQETRTTEPCFCCLVFSFNWDSLHARLNSHKAWNYKKKKHKKIRAYRKSVWKEPTVKRCLLNLDSKPLRSYVKGKHSVGREFQSLAVRGKKLLT